MIDIAPAAAREMIEHAEQCYPLECCGVLVGKDSSVVRAVRCENAYLGDQSDRFEIRTDDIFRLQHEARNLGEEIVGFFHSHPDESAYFSTTDLNHASPWHSHIVLSVREGRFQGARSFRVDLDLTQSQEEEMQWPLL